MDTRPCNSSQDVEVRKGPWTMEEDLILINYIANHGEGVWNSLAKAAGLKRTGKSCRLRWLNYLRPDVRRGNITPEEQLLIMELHAKWGNKWSKIAKHLPGRTDNEIKNYWRTRIQKHIRQGENNNFGTPTQSSCAMTNHVISEDHYHYHHHQHHQQQNSENVDGNNTGVGSSNSYHQISYNNTVNDIPMEGYSPSSYQPSNLVDSFSSAALPPNYSNDNYWSMDDLWSMQLLNAE